MGKLSTIKSSLRLLESLYGAIDRSMASLYERSDVPCKKGCSDCCYQLVTASIAEAAYVLLPIIKDAEARKYHNENRSPKIAEQAKLMETSTVDSWWQGVHPCVFLSNGICSVYERRPVACRSCAVVGTAERCKIGSIKKVMKFDYREMTREGIKVSVEVCKNLGIPAVTTPFPQALMLATILLTRGVEQFRSVIRGTIYEDPLATAIYWNKVEPNGDKYLELPSLPLPKLS